ncbi:MAG: XRE family transcriptional regulator [Clostridiales bacterium]|nr:MAG: XRE family transcriptional regulator [Clostridiales bacterium]
MDENVVQVAMRIRELREVMEYTEETVAEKIGLSVEEYKKYENGELDIPISVIYGVAGVLGVDSTVLLSGETPRMKAYTVTRKGKGISIERYKEYKFSSLAYNFIDREMDPMIVDLLPKDTPPEMVTHKGQEFNYVLSGTVTVIINGKRKILNEGDCIYFDPSVPHGQMAENGPARFLTVINENAHR